MQSDKVYQVVPASETSRRHNRQQSVSSTLVQLISRRKSQSLFLLAFVVLVMYITLSIVVPSESWLVGSRSGNYMTTVYYVNEAHISTKNKVHAENTQKSTGFLAISTKTPSPSTLSTQGIHGTERNGTQQVQTITKFFRNATSGKVTHVPTLTTKKIPTSLEHFFSPSTRAPKTTIKKQLTTGSATKGKLFQKGVTKRTQPPKSTPFIDKEMACHFPRLDPFDESIIHLVKKPAPVDCTDSLPLLFNSTLNSTIVPLDDIREYFTDIESCCYWEISRGHGSDDNDYIFSEDCHPLSLDSPTTIPREHEYIVISCTITNNSVEATSKESDASTFQRDLDMHIFAPIKPKVEQRIEAYYDKLNKTYSDKSQEDVRLEHNKLNVVILGIDAVSHMNLQRTMKKSYSFLVNNLSAIGMNGFNKIGDNTFPNVAALLTQLNSDEMKRCEKRKSFDSCPFIWKHFAKSGYRTGFIEDTPWMGAFNYLKKGFKKIPVDFYFRPFALSAEELVATHKKLNTQFCYGPRLAFEVVLDYIKKLAFAMGEMRRYFLFTWTSSLTHDYLNTPYLGDELLLNTLQWFDFEGYLNNTMFILMSDHGIRWGDIRDYLQGQLEERLPFLFFVPPSSFKKRYPQAMENLRINQDRLTTPFDMHATLMDLLDLNELGSERLAQRELELKASEEQGKLPRAISLFLAIPKSRSCLNANIPEHYCTCHDSMVVNITHPMVNQVANYAVFSINYIVSEYPKCAFLTLNTIKHAQEVRTQFTSAYQIAFTTVPGDGAWEASIIKNDEGYWQVSGSISRTNLYGNQSHCVDAKDVKLYCFCIDLINVDDNSIK